MLQRRRSGWLTAMIVSAVLAPIPFLAGMVGNALTMVHAFEEVSHSGKEKPSRLAERAATGMVWTAVGLAGSAIGGVALLISTAGFLLSARTAPVAAGERLPTGKPPA